MEPFDAIVGRLFPSFVRGALIRTGPGCDTAHAGEREVVATAGPTRRQEFLCGRACAHDALGTIGRDAGPIGVGSRRQPLWPSGAIGSISHAGKWSGAVVARAEDAWAIGFDMEVVDPPLAPEVERLVLTADEQRPGPFDDHPLGHHRSKIAFSAKESVYKCLFPRTAWDLDFSDLVVELDLEALRGNARVADRFRRPGIDVADLEVGVAVTGGYLFTGTWIAASGPGGHRGSVKG